MSDANTPPERPTRPDLSRLLIMGPPGAGRGTQTKRSVSSGGLRRVQA